MSKSDKFIRDVRQKLLAVAKMPLRNRKIADFDKKIKLRNSEDGAKSNGKYLFVHL